MSGTMLPGNLIEKILQILPSLTSLDISDNDFGDEGLIDVCEALKNHKSIIELKLDRNWIHRSKSSTLLNNTTFFSNSDQVHVF
jgi:Ran GTPase-activating protein (RanGAP) involved in mRNA processing and transport